MHKPLFLNTRKISRKRKTTNTHPIPVAGVLSHRESVFLLAGPFKRILRSALIFSPMHRIHRLAPLGKGPQIFEFKYYNSKLFI